MKNFKLQILIVLLLFANLCFSDEIPHQAKEDVLSITWIFMGSFHASDKKNYDWYLDLRQQYKTSDGKIFVPYKIINAGDNWFSSGQDGIGWFKLDCQSYAGEELGA